MTTPCTPLTVVEVGAQDVTFTADDESDPVFTGDNAGLTLSGADVTCCSEEQLTVGVFYNNQWYHNNIVDYEASLI